MKIIAREREGKRKGIYEGNADEQGMGGGGRGKRELQLGVPFGFNTSNGSRHRF